MPPLTPTLSPVEVGYIRLRPLWNAELGWTRVRWGEGARRVWGGVFGQTSLLQQPRRLVRLLRAGMDGERRDVGERRRPHARERRIGLLEIIVVVDHALHDRRRLRVGHLARGDQHHHA